MMGMFTDGLTGTITRRLRCLGHRRLKKKKTGRRSCLLTFIVISVRDISTNFFNSQLFT